MQARPPLSRPTPAPLNVRPRPHRPPTGRASSGSRACSPGRTRPSRTTCGSSSPRTSRRASRSRRTAARARSRRRWTRPGAGCGGGEGRGRGGCGGRWYGKPRMEWESCMRSAPAARGVLVVRGLKSESLLIHLHYNFIGQHACSRTGWELGRPTVCMQGGSRGGSRLVHLQTHPVMNLVVRKGDVVLVDRVPTPHRVAREKRRKWEGSAWWRESNRRSRWQRTISSAGSWYDQYRFVLR